MKSYSLYSKLWLPVSIVEVFNFFSDAANLEKITPSWLQFKIITTGPLKIQRGSLIDYRLKLRGIPIQWQSEITVWEPPHRFVDEQRKGPYRFWIHEHCFREEKEGTLIEDKVNYAVAGGSLIHRFLVRPDLEKIFDFRKQTIESLFLSKP